MGHANPRAWLFDRSPDRREPIGAPHVPRVLQGFAPIVAAAPALDVAIRPPPESAGDAAWTARCALRRARTGGERAERKAGRLTLRPHCLTAAPAGRSPFDTQPPARPRESAESSDPESANRVQRRGRQLFTRPRQRQTHEDRCVVHLGGSLGVRPDERHREREARQGRSWLTAPILRVEKSVPPTRQAEDFTASKSRETVRGRIRFRSRATLPRPRAG